MMKAVADPGFPVGGAPTRWGGGANLRCVHFLAKTYAKMKEIDPVGGGAHAGSAPLDPPMEGTISVHPGMGPNDTFLPKGVCGPTGKFEIRPCCTFPPYFIHLFTVTFLHSRYSSCRPLRRLVFSSSSRSPPSRWADASS